MLKGVCPPFFYFYFFVDKIFGQKHWTKKKKKVQKKIKKAQKKITKAGTKKEG